MPTPSEHQAAIQAVITSYQTAKTQAQAELDAVKAKVDQDLANAKAQIQATVDAADADVKLAEGEMVSLESRVRVLVRKDGKLQVETLKTLADLQTP